MTISFSVDLDEVVHYEPPHSDLHCLPSSLLKAWPRDYKTFFMLNSIEHEIFPAHKC